MGDDLFFCHAPEMSPCVQRPVLDDSPAREYRTVRPWSQQAGSARRHPPTALPGGQNANGLLRCQPKAWFRKFRPNSDFKLENPQSMYQPEEGQPATALRVNASLPG